MKANPPIRSGLHAYRFQPPAFTPRVFASPPRLLVRTSPRVPALLAMRLPSPRAGAHVPSPRGVLHAVGRGLG